MAAACTLTTDLDGLAGSDSPSFDGGGATGDATGDATSDAPATVDGDKPATDSGADTGPPGEAGPAAFCVREPGHLFCSDFESGSVLDGKWEGTAFNLGALTREVIAPASGIGNLVSTTQAVASGEAHAVVIKKFTQTIKSMTLTTSVKLGTCVPSGTGLISVVSLGGGPANDLWVAAILITPGGIVMNATNCPSGTCTGQNNTLTSAPPVNVWSRIAMTLDLVASTATVTLNGAPVLDKQPVLLTPENGSALINIGAFARAPAGACRIEYDDVTFDVQ